MCLPFTALGAESAGTSVSIESQQADGSVLARGQQRFTVLRQWGRNCTVRFRPELPLTSVEPLRAQGATTMHDLAYFIASGLPGRPRIGIPWLHNTLDAQRQVAKAHELLAEMHDWLAPASCMNQWHAGDAAQLASILSARLPTDDATRVALLAMDSPNERLARVVQLLGVFRQSAIACRHCGVVLVKARDLFFMSADGALGAYVNPSGYVHQIVTFRCVESGPTLTLHSSAKDSWFPGLSFTGMARPHDAQATNGLSATAAAASTLAGATTALRAPSASRGSFGRCAGT